MLSNKKAKLYERIKKRENEQSQKKEDLKSKQREIKRKSKIEKK